MPLHLLSLISVLPPQDLEKVQMHLEEVRFFDLFGYSEETGAWQCFMCNNPEKATGTQGSCLCWAGCVIMVGRGEKDKPSCPVAILIGILH